MTVLPRIRTDLLKHPLEKQLLVYDTRWDQVHLLDQTTACVMQLLEEGGWTREGITAELSERLGIEPNPGLLPLAIEELRAAALLDVPIGHTSDLDSVSRRELVKSLALGGAAALLMPAVATLTATPGYAQGGTAPNKGLGGTCSSNSQCISNNCCNLVCVPTSDVCAGAGTVPNGGSCSNTGQCSQSGATCTGGVCKGPAGSGCNTAAGCQSNTCCGSQCRNVGCSNSTANGSCLANGHASGETKVDQSCCSGLCKRDGGSSNYSCTATVTCT